ncbi:hypothetical protein [Rhodoferax saidenbachensis]|uniref:Uncharacterized protein YcfJ n=1 Tax=Rhodoferax saidenbachensis TaxID=1484693 RepID=A0ABU1ZQY7_9BURK|nr:hypothetical protein [Rhodoferax saidenbachensis]MDR7307967.1 uncharacterized protein YcfJ [Rhodoferax saidenbachensis]
MTPLAKTLVSSFVLALGGTCLAQAQPQDVGRVLSSTPVQQQVAMPRQVCSNQQVAVQPQKSGAGAVMGAIAGGAMGNAVGRGSGQAAATVIGLIGGAIVGNRIEGNPEPQVQTVQTCSTQNFYENRTVAYNVVYEYAGRQYSVQMPNDPGPTIPLSVAPIGASPQQEMPPAYAAAPPQPVYTQPPVVVMSQPVYPIYYTRPYYPPVNLHFGYGWGWGGHHHWR